MKKIIKNCSLYNKSGIFNILIEKSVIIEITQNKIDEEVNTLNDLVLDVGKRIVIPGLIDTHIQGAGGYDFLDNDSDGLITISKTLAKHGVTGFLATTVIKPTIENEHIKKVNNFIANNESGARCLGFHLEGPFINKNKKGGLNPDGIFEPSLKLLDEILDVCENNLRIMTIAPELPNNDKIIRKLVKNNVIASIGHTEATFSQTFSGFCNGITHATHIFNAMPSIHHRDPGPIPAIINQKDVFAEVISDGFHLNPGIVRFLYNSLGFGKTICITDGVQAIGIPEGKYFYNEKEYFSKDGVAKYPNGTLIGSAISLLEIILRYKEFSGSTFEEAVITGSRNPAKILGLDKQMGSIEVGKIADIVILDYDFSVFRTLIDGKIIYSKEQK